jgi:hypothetical protein
MSGVPASPRNIVVGVFNPAQGEALAPRTGVTGRIVGNSEAKGIYKGLHLGLQFIDESDRPARMRRAYTIGAPSVFVNKNGLGRFPEFRDQGVGGSNPLSPTNPFNNLEFWLPAGAPKGAPIRC